MITAFIGDMHLDSRTPVSRVDNYRQVTINKLLALLKLCVDNNVKAVFHTGDFFHEYDQSMTYLNEVVTVLIEFKNKGIAFYSTIGNHDLPRNLLEKFKTTPLSLLFKSGVVKHTVVEDLGNLVVYGLDFTQGDVIPVPDKSKNSLLVMHYSTDGTVANDSISRSKLSDFNIVVSGHDHKYYPPTGDMPLMLRPGSFTRRTKEDYNLTRDIIVYLVDTEDLSVGEFHLPGVEPAALVFRNEAFSGPEDDIYSNKYNSLFNEDYFNADAQDIFKIIELLPLTVFSQSREAVIEHLKNKGVVRL